MALGKIQQYIDQLSKNKNVQNVVGEFTKLGEELRKRTDDLNVRFNEEREKTLKQAHAKVNEAMKAAAKAQAELDKEVNAAIAKIRKSAERVETNLEYYRKKAVAQKTKLEKALRARAKAAAGPKKKAAKKRAGSPKKKTRRA